MIEVVSLETMRAMDKYTCKKKRITSQALMLHVASKLANYLMKHDKVINQKGAVIAGLGNNGGDAIALADNLVKNGFDCELFIVGESSKLSIETANILSQVAINYKWIATDNDCEEIGKVFNEYDYLIEGLFGIGLNRNVEGIYAKIIQKINHANLYTFSVDIASGLDAETGTIQGIAVKANETLVIQCAKYGHYLQDGKDFSGLITVIDVGILSTKAMHKAFVLDKDMIKKTLPKRIQNSHKYHYGNVMVFGGSFEMMGAPNLAAEAALRTGSGLVSIAISKKHKDAFYRFKHEVMVNEYRSDDIEMITNKKNALLFGPGLSKDDAQYEKTLLALIELKIPLVIDADGLNYFKEIYDESIITEHIILTPHLGEFSKLVNKDAKSIMSSPIKEVEAFMKHFKGLLVLKGPSTIIAYQELVFIMPYGGALLATAGSGDVLGGIIMSLIGRGKSLIDAVCLGTLIHALAGNDAEEVYGEDSVLAQDIINHIPSIIKAMK